MGSCGHGARVAAGQRCLRHAGCRAGRDSGTRQHAGFAGAALRFARGPARAGRAQARRLEYPCAGALRRRRHLRVAAGPRAPVGNARHRAPAGQGDFRRHAVREVHPGQAVADGAVQPQRGAQALRAADRQARARGRAARGVRHEPGGRALRQRARDGRPAAGCHQLQRRSRHTAGWGPARGGHAAHRPHPPDPRACGRPGLSRPGRYALWRHPRRADVPACGKHFLCRSRYGPGDARLFPGGLRQRGERGAARRMH